MSPRTSEANDLIHGERRMTILNAALGIFVERGFEGTRIQEIADRSSLSYGLVYHYFSSKEEVFRTLVEMALGAAGSLIKALPDSPSPESFGSFVAQALADPSPLYFALIVEALTKRGVPADLADKARETVLGFQTALAAAGDFPRLEGAARAEAILAILLGTSIMKVCGLSDGSFAYPTATMLATGSKE
ncbi:MAG: TetR/AcrR family transcriptional regulator [Spirochaetota bacterium]